MFDSLRLAVCLPDRSAITFSLLRFWRRAACAGGAVLLLLAAVCPRAAAQSIPSFVVNTAADDATGTAGNCTSSPEGSCTLRDALAAAQNAGAGAITFDATVFAASNRVAANTITLTYGLLIISPNTTITGPAPTLVEGVPTPVVTVSGNDDSTVFSFVPSQPTATATIANLTIANGVAQFYCPVSSHCGGGIYTSGTLTVTGSTFSNNFAPNGEGAGMYTSGTVTVANSVFLNNNQDGSSGDGGGGIYNTGLLTVTGSTFEGNSAYGDGGGIVNEGTLTVTGSTFSENSSQIGSGGGILNFLGTTTVIGSTFSKNSSPDSYGGGISTSGGTLALANDILDGNPGGDLDDSSGNSSFPAPVGSSGNCSGVVLCNGGGNVVATYNGHTVNPAPISLAPLTNYGGPTQTMIPLPGSPGICAGTAAPGGGLTLPATDQRGDPRTNTSYPGYSADSPCVDSGAVQTSYAMDFTTEPEPIAPATAIEQRAGFEAAVTLDERGVPFGSTVTPAGTGPSVTIPLTLDGSGSLVNGAVGTVNGVATYSDLLVSAPGTGDTLTANLTLNGALPTPLALSTVSDSFSVEPGVVAQLGFSTPPQTPIQAGANQPAVVVQEQSASGEPITGGTDAIVLTVTGPNNYSQAYTATAVNGAATFSPGVLTVGGVYTYSAALKLNPSIHTPTPATQVLTTVAGLSVKGYPSPWYADVPGTATITALDQNGNLFQTYSGTATVTTSDSAATITGSPVTLTNGVGQVTVAFGTAGTQSITATVTGLPPASQTGIVIQTPPPDTFVVNTTADDATGMAANCTNLREKTCTLRDALAAAQNAGAGNITFDRTVFAASNSASVNTITLSSAGTLSIPSSTTIQGLTSGSGATPANLVTVSGNNTSTVFSFMPSQTTATASIANLNVANGAGSGSGDVNCTGAEVCGGGIYTNGGTLTVTGSTLSSNSASGRFGGGIYTSAAVTVSNSAFLNNSGSEGGGIANFGTVTVAGSTFEGNSAGGGGGAIVNFGTLTVTGSTFSGNSSELGTDEGGGILNDYATATVTGSTLSNNLAGGISTYGGTLALANDILDGNGTFDLNDNTYGGTPPVFPAPIGSGGSCSGVFLCNGGGNVVGIYDYNPVNPAPVGLAPLANYAGPTQTMIPLPGSPAICAGTATPGGGLTLPATDQRGDPRTNTSYPGYSADSPCVDAGAVQTNYAMDFTTEPEPIAPNTAIGAGLPFPAAVTLDESGVPFGSTVTPAGTGPSVTIPLTLDGSGSLVNGAAGTVNGVATYSDLLVSTPGTGDTLTANLTLNGGLAPPLAISAASSPFSVVALPPVLPPALSVTPSSGYGTAQQFSFTGTSPLGAGQVLGMYMLFSDTVSAQNACYLRYAPKTGLLYLAPNSGAVLGTGAKPGSSGTLSNSQCSVNLADTTASASGSDVTVSPSITFSSGFAGGKRIWLQVVDTAGHSTGWSQVGTWMVGAAGESAPSAVSVSPSSGQGMSQTFAFTASSPDGAANLTALYMVLGPDLHWANNCSLYYDAASGKLSLMSNSGTSWGAGEQLGSSGTLSNSQCSVSLAGATAVSSGNTLTVNVPVSFNSSMDGTIGIWMKVKDAYGQSWGWGTMGSWTVGSGATVEAPPSVVSVTPSSGYGTSQQFSAVVASPLGWKNLAWVNILLNQSLTAARACELRYLVSANLLYLVTDNGAGLSAGGAPGSSGTLSNSQCTVSLSATTVSGSGNDLTLSPALSFSSGFSGTAHLWISASDALGEFNSWKSMGWWTVGTAAPADPPPSAVSVTPSSGYGTSQQFSFEVSSPSGASQLSWVYMLMNSEFSIVKGCYLRYGMAANRLYLMADNGASWGSGGVPGVAGTLSNSQCTVSLAGTTVTASGNTLTVAPSLTFQPSFYGSREVWLNASDAHGGAADWSQVGWWTAYTSAEAPPSAVSVAPSSGYGLTQQSVFTASSPDTTGNLSSVSILMNSTLSASRACELKYVTASGLLYLFSDDGSSQGTGAAPGSTGTLSNSQCSVNLATTAVSSTGNNLTLSPTLTFNSAGFAGSRQIWMNATDDMGLSTNWKVLGSWNVGSSPSAEQPPAIVSLSPAQGAGTAQQFSVTAASPDGAAYLETIELQFQGSGTTNNCEIMYQQSSGLFYLLNDSGTAWSAGAQPGTTATLSNSQCTVSLASTIVLSSGNNLTIEPSVSFSSSFAGTRQIWLYAADQFGEWAGWSHEGNWTIPSD